MKVTVIYDTGRIDVFDDSRFTAATPFGKNTMLANYELRFDKLGETGLWLRVHHYDINANDAPKDPDGNIPKASRNKGWQFLLAERDEIEHIVEIKADERELAFRVGEELVDAAKFRQMVDLCVNDASKKSKAQCAAEIFETLSTLPDASVADPASIAARFGFGLHSLDTALAISACSPKELVEQSSHEENGKADITDDWMEGFDDEDSD